MPVKNVKRKTNDGFEGVITGLNDKEKEIIANSVASDRCLQNKNGNYTSTDGERIINSITFSDEELAKIRNGKIDIISGEYIYDSNGNSESYNTIRESLMEYEGQLYAFYRGSRVNDFTTTTIEVREFQLIINPDGSSLIQIWRRQQIKTPILPSDASSKNYSLEANNGTIAWTESSGGAMYTAGKNISISKTNEISVADEMSNLKSIELANSDSRYQNVSISSQYNSLSMKKKDGLPQLFFSRNSTPYKSVELLWLEEPYDGNSQICFSLHNESKAYYAFTSRSKVPDVPTSDGTYVLKATVSSGTLTYSWVKEGE